MQTQQEKIQRKIFVIFDYQECNRLLPTNDYVYSAGANNQDYNIFNSY